jgi:hypothetical protein
MVETLQRHPTPDFTQRCDAVLSAGGALTRLLPMLVREAYPTWFRSFVALEAEALAIHEFEVQVVPGLFQTEDYARAVLAAAWPPQSPEDTERRLKARLERQQILTRDHPPLLSVILDESILRRPVGGSDVMARQLQHLVELAARPHIKLHILTYQCAANTHMAGSFTVLELPKRERLVYVEGTGSGQILPAPDEVERLARTFEAVRGEAMSTAKSVEFIDCMREELYEHR